MLDSITPRYPKDVAVYRTLTMDIKNSWEASVTDRRLVFNKLVCVRSIAAQPSLVYWGGVFLFSLMLCHDLQARIFL